MADEPLLLFFGDRIKDGDVWGKMRMIGQIILLGIFGASVLGRRSSEN